MTLATFIKQLLTVTAAALGIIIFNEIGLASYWQQQLPVIGAGISCIAAVIAWRFGHSRLVFANLVILTLCAIESSPDQLVTNLNLPIALSSLLISAMAWFKDKGVLSKAGVITLTSLFTLMCIFIIFEAQITTNLNSGVGEVVNELPASQPASWSAEHYITMFAFVISLIRWLFQPSNGNTGLLTLVALLVVVICNPISTYELVLFGGAVSLYFVLAESYSMAFKDELTGIPSRRALLQHKQRLNNKYTVVMGDVDHFKKFNDTYGHDVGDQVLKLVASKLAQVRGGGKAYRYGGEEFTLVFAGKSPQEARPYIEEVRQSIQDYSIVLRNKSRPKKPPKKKQPSANSKTVHVTCSFGMAELSDRYRTFDEVMKQADVALYKAKKAGRNCVK